MTILDEIVKDIGDGKYTLPALESRRGQSQVSDILKHLAGFEKNQNEQGDRYGAEILHNAAREIERLSADVTVLRNALEATPAVIPDSWLDPLLSGTDSHVNIPAGCPDIERLLGELRKRLEVHSKDTLAAVSGSQEDSHNG